MKQKSLKVGILLLTIFFLSGCASDNSQQKAALGEVDFKVTGDATAQPHFKKGLLLLHSFEFEDAAESFSMAHSIDPDFAMAYWGEAMTYNHPLWRYQNKEKADSILKMLGSSPEQRVSKTKSAIEKDFIRAVDILYGNGSKAERDDKYAAFMESLYRKYPGHTEVASFYSVALLGSVEIGRDTTVYGHAAEIAKQVIANHPDHPGALHYLIHSYDDPDHAERALAAADAYALVAPDASHALHMPSHIYLALGLWDKVISSNEVAWAASELRKQRKLLGNDALGYHSFHWLMYGYLQKGRIADAKKLVEEMKQYCDTLPSNRAREHMILLKSTYLVESNDWQSTIASIEVKSDDLNVSVRAMDQFVNGLNAYYSKDKSLLNNVISAMKMESVSAHEMITGEGGHSCGSVNAVDPNLLDIQYAEVMQMELEAMYARMNNDSAATDEWFKKATTLENSISYSFGPPTVVKPSNEMYGEWLLSLNEPAAAKYQFELALKATPNKTLPVNGLAKANTMLSEKKGLTKN